MHNDNNNMYTNNMANNYAKPEEITNFNQIEEGGTPEVSNKQRRRKCCSCALPKIRLGYLLLALLTISAILLLAYIWGCINAHIGSYSNRDKAKVFRTECKGVGGRVVDVNRKIPGWGVSYINCVHERPGPGGQDLILGAELTTTKTKVVTRTRSFDMRTGEVTELGLTARS